MNRKEKVGVLGIELSDTKVIILFSKVVFKRVKEEGYELENNN